MRRKYLDRLSYTNEFHPFLFIISNTFFLSILVIECLSTSSLILRRAYLEFSIVENQKSIYVYSADKKEPEKKCFLVPYCNNDLFISLSMMFFSRISYLKTKEYRSQSMFMNLKINELISNHMSTRERFNQ